ncbi:MAG: acyl-CoA reductase [Alphaproteobacteria bacterium]|nr:acyl-CoA reductase [Alphaproteobacteria bacterium]
MKQDEFLFLQQCLSLENPQCQATIKQAHLENKWFIPEFIEFAIKHIHPYYLKPTIYHDIYQKYPLLNQSQQDVKIGLIMAGNIPLAGFYDLLALWMSPFKIVLKLSSKDNCFMKYVIEALRQFNSGFQDKIEYSDYLKNCDAYIISGSNQTLSALKPYIQNKPHIMRGHKTSIAVLTGQESESELQHLAKDIFMYFGMGCRNVSKLYVPENFDLLSLKQHFQEFEFIKNHFTYHQNLEYRLSVYLLNQDQHIYQDFYILKNSSFLSPPIGVIYYETYNEISALNLKLKGLNEQIQTIVGLEYVPFGEAQLPNFWDFPDGIDIYKFLENQCL